MPIHFSDVRESILWRRVGALAWSMGNQKNDNPFRKYLSVLEPEGVPTATWLNKMRAWDQGWEGAAARAKPRRESLGRIYLPRSRWVRFAAEVVNAHRKP